MAGPSTSALLDAWERGLDQPLPRRVLLLLAAHDGQASIERLADLTIGQRDARLLYLRQGLFGPHLTVVAGCPACRAPLEAEFLVSDVLQDGAADAAGVHEATIDGWRLVFRLPASRDLIDLAEAAPVQTAHLSLLTRCLFEAVAPSGQAVGPAALPEAILGELEQRMAAADPQAEVMLNLSCPACDHRWAAVFDIALFVWREINAWAQRLLADVHRLAGAYGWREADILALGPRRRQVYLELAGR